MHGLRAVVPNRCCVVDEDGEYRSGHAGSELESREDAFHGRRDAVDRNAGAIEVGLYHGVIL